MDIWNIVIITNSIVCLVILMSVSVLCCFQVIDLSTHCSSYFLAFAILLIFYWVPDIVDFTLLRAKYCFVPTNTFEVLFCDILKLLGSSFIVSSFAFKTC